MYPWHDCLEVIRRLTLLVECATDSHSQNLLKSRLLCNVPIKVTPHSSLNSCKGVIRSRDLEGVSEEEICENLTLQGVVGVKRINICRNNELVYTHIDFQLTNSAQFG